MTQGHQLVHRLPVIGLIEQLVERSGRRAKPADQLPLAERTALHFFLRDQREFVQQQIAHVSGIAIVFEDVVLDGTQRPFLTRLRQQPKEDVAAVLSTPSGSAQYNQAGLADLSARDRPGTKSSRLNPIAWLTKEKTNAMPQHLLVDDRAADESVR
jgi:hypothetical protein